MSTRSIPHNRPARNRTDSSNPQQTNSSKARRPRLHVTPVYSDLVCPVATCRAVCAFSSGRGLVYCLTCGWELALTPEQTSEIVEALAGITDLNMPAYLLALAATEGGDEPPPPPDGDPARRPRLLYLDALEERRLLVDVAGSYSARKVA